MPAVSDAHLLDAPPPLARGSALFLDFDGTLAPIAARPEDVVLPDWVVPTLEALRSALGGALAVVSGRPLAQLDTYLQPLRLPAAGVHGVERRRADGRLRLRPVEPPAAALAAAEQAVAAHPALRLERKPGGMALHYRQAPELEAWCRTALLEALADAPQWQLLEGKRVFEVKQRNLSKATAVRAFLAEAPFEGRRPVFVGDDATDEDGMREAQAAGGVGVKVGAGETVAGHRLADVEAVGRWLRQAAGSLG